MDNTVLKKRLNTFKSSKGSFTRISDEVIIDVLRAWEQWPGTTADFYRDLGIRKGQCSSIIKKAKKLVKSGIFPESDFKEIIVEDNVSQTTQCPPVSGCNIELVYKNNIIKFGDHKLLINFLNEVDKKAA